MLLGAWSDALDGVHELLLPPLMEIFRDSGRSDTERTVAMSLIANYAADRPELLSEIIQDADAKQFAILFPQLEAYRDQAAAVMNRTLERTLVSRVSDDDKDLLAKRQANAAAALLRLGKAENVWGLFQHQPDPRTRSYLVHRVASLGVDPAIVIKRLEEEQDTSARRALLLSLGEFTLDQLTESLRQSLIPKIAKLYENDPDAGTHAAAEWLLERWGQTERIVALNRQWSHDEPWRKERLDEIRREIGRNLAGKNAFWYVTKSGHPMVVVTPVDFLVGSPATEIGREGGPAGKAEQQHSMHIGRSFAIGAKEVTVAQFLEFRPAHQYNSQFSPSDNDPVNSVNWYQAAAYCNWLSRQDNIDEDQWCYLPNAANEYAEGMKLAPDYLHRTGYRLPTEAEWEYACRAGATTSRYFGETDDLLCQYAWCTKNSLDRSTEPSGRMKPNDLGLFDMLGNVMEWSMGKPVGLSADPDKMPGDDLEDTADMLRIEDTKGRIAHGGSFLSYTLNVRAAFHNWNRPSFPSQVTGFRIVRTVP